MRIGPIRLCISSAFLYFLQHIYGRNVVYYFLKKILFRSRRIELIRPKNEQKEADKCVYGPGGGGGLRAHSKSYKKTCFHQILK